MKEPIRILNIVPNMRAAGIETFIMNVYRNIDRSKVQFDFIVHNKDRNFYDDEIEKLGGKIYRLSFKDDKNILKYIKNLNDFFKIHKEYKIVHGHMQSMMPLYLYMAKKNGVPIRIAHSHNGSFEKTIKGFILHMFSRFSKFFSTNNWACSNVAGKYLFGKTKFMTIYNGIDTEKFKYSEKIRAQKRKELNILDENIILHVGRFEKQKNHRFLIDWFEQYIKQDNNAILLLVGEGTLLENLKAYVKKKKLNKKIKFLGIRNDIHELMQAADIFALPSLYEGLPVVGIEAQYSNLMCMFSNKITTELKFIENVEFLPIKHEDFRKWTKAAFKKYNRNNVKFIDEKKFDIKYICNIITNEYERLNDEN